MLLNGQAADAAPEGTGTGTGIADPKPTFDVALPDNWIEHLDEDIRAEPLLKGFKDVKGLAKSLVHAQKMVGKDKIVIPDKHATDEQWMDIYHKLGLPSSIDEYEVEVPENSGVDEEAISDLLSDLHKAGVLPKQAQVIVNKMVEQQTLSMAKYDQQLETSRKENLEILQKEWGNKFNVEIGKAQAAVREFASEGLTKEIEALGLGDNAEFIKMMAKVGSLLGEDKLIDAGVTPQQSSVADAQRFIQEVNSNLNHPYWDEGHPNHKAAVDEFTKKFKVAHSIK